MIATEKEKAIIELKGATLRIPVGKNKTKNLKKTIVKALTGGHLRRSQKGDEIYALDNVDCKIFQGERVALIGHNGAGKSTFLRLISGIYKQTEGEIITRCKIHPMIQKNFITGPDLSGLQAVKGHYLLNNKKLIGFEEYLEDIVEFSELGEYINMPMKGYSEGMSARLLFSILTSGHHECLALDEGFGTGDAKFFKKAQERLEKFINTTGTLILASHSDELLKQFCERGLVFQKGKIAYDGSIVEALKYYHEND